jgi:hypothetical protein
MVISGRHARETIRPDAPLRYHSAVAGRDSHRTDNRVRRPRAPEALREGIRTLRGIVGRLT